jgi:N-methylhydantoinase B
VVRADGRREEVPSKKMLTLHPGDQLWEYVAGGAGHGDPLERDPDLVLADVLDGKISRESARADYGVALTPGDAAVDHEVTKMCRDAQRAARGPINWMFDRGAGEREP